MASEKAELVALFKKLGVPSWDDWNFDADGCMGGAISLAKEDALEDRVCFAFDEDGRFMGLFCCENRVWERRDDMPLVITQGLKGDDAKI